MEITWYGHSCFRLMERGVASIVADPFDESIGYPLPNLRADIVTISHNAPGHATFEYIKKVNYVLDRPGEYEIGGVFITGVATYHPDPEEGNGHRNIVFVYDFNDIVVGHLGNLDHVPSQSQIEQLGGIDVLLVPVGGGGALNSSQASEVISLIEPAIVIPMHYATPEYSLNLDPLDKFLKEMGVSAVEAQDTLRIRGMNLSEDTEIVVLNAQQ
ncbi:MAG: MBL fold metallo-hydrolase [Anaerolineae bacterium]|nr:MBL fold metallo-hydrolase [Anaerolineae bacterium]